MKWIVRILVPMHLLLVSSRQCFASILISFTPVSREWAVRTRPHEGAPAPGLPRIAEGILNK